jgi:N-dimethylarginine dimethylaminohydrolase
MPNSMTISQLTLAYRQDFSSQWAGCTLFANVSVCDYDGLSQTEISVAPIILQIDPAHFDVSYAINPWMKPSAWMREPDVHRHSARLAWDTLRSDLVAAGAEIQVARGAPGWPDMAFPANAAVVLDGRALLGRFRHPERRGEEVFFREIFEGLQRQGLLREIAELPPGRVQEGAGDAIWDTTRQVFWTGFGPRSEAAASSEIAAFFGRDTVSLELATSRFYHLDTCFCPLSGGEVLFFPPAFTAAALGRIRERVAPHLLIEAAPDEAAAFCVNAVSIGPTIVMAKAPPRLRAILAERGYQVNDIDLSPFILSGGGAFCMTLRLDLKATQDPAIAHVTAQPADAGPARPLVA